MKVVDIKHLVLSGGGMLGISYIGLIKYLEENSSIPIVKNLKSLTGCSVGAMFATFIALGYTYTELNIIVKSMIFKEYMNINCSLFTSILIRYVNQNKFID